jgi:AMP phosphorylase
MFLKAVKLHLEAEKPIVILNKSDAEELDVKPLDRVEILFKNKKLIGIVNIAEKFIGEGYIGLYEMVCKQMKINSNDVVKVSRTEPPRSLEFIKKKLNGAPLTTKEINQVIKDVVAKRLSDIELTTFIISLHNHGMNMEEIASLSEAMAFTGDMLDLGKKEIYDKHSIGGCPGDKTSMVLVPTVAAAGLIIPKTSSRSITSPAGTADKMECLSPVDLSLEEIKRVVKKTNGCLVWGGAVNLAPADDVFIQIEYLLSIDPLLLPSVMSKKRAVGCKYLAIDIPTGKNAKIKSIQEAEKLASQFIELGKRLNIKVSCLSSYAEQPIGHNIGPALEAKEALETLMNRKNPEDLLDKVCDLAGNLFRFKGIKNPEKKAIQIIKSGKAEKKFREIIEAQGGNGKVKPEEIAIGDKVIKIDSAKSGVVLWLNNSDIVRLARIAGAPKDKGAGIVIHKKINEKVKRGETLFEIYAEKTYKLNRALKEAENMNIFGIGKKYEMTLAKIPEEESKPCFILER